VTVNKSEAARCAALTALKAHADDLRSTRDHTSRPHNRGATCIPTQHADHAAACHMCVGITTGTLTHKGMLLAYSESVECPGVFAF